MAVIWLRLTRPLRSSLGHEKNFVFVCCKNWDLALLCFYNAPALPRQGWWSESHPRMPSNSSQFQSKINKNKLQIPVRFQFPFLSAFGNYFYSEKEDKKFSLYFWCMVSDYQVILTNIYVYGSKVNDSTQISKLTRFISRYISVKSNDKRLWFRFSSFGRTTYKNNKQAKNTSRYNQTTTFWSENAFRKKTHTLKKLSLHLAPKIIRGKIWPHKNQKHEKLRTTLLLYKVAKINILVIFCSLSYIITNYLLQLLVH